MNGTPLREMDKIISPVCKLCRDHVWTGFVNGMKVGLKDQGRICSISVSSSAVNVVPVRS